MKMFNFGKNNRQKFFDLEIGTTLYEEISDTFYELGKKHSNDTRNAKIYQLDDNGQETNVINHLITVGDAIGKYIMD